MQSSVEQGGKARFDARLTRDQKLVIEKAAILAGYKNLSDFVVSTVYERAQVIIQRSEAILASHKDSELFFNALLNPPKPNEALKSALRQYRESGLKP